MAAIDCEGGPGLNATLVPAGLVDELHLVIAPKLAGGRDPLTILGGDPLDPPADLALLSLHESGGYLFARYGLSVTAPRTRYARNGDVSIAYQVAGAGPHDCCSSTRGSRRGSTCGPSRGWRACSSA